MHLQYSKHWYTMGKYSGKTCRLLTMLSMTASFFLVEIVVGYITNSIALVADSFHMLSDVVALIVGFASVRISKWRTQKNTFGWARAEVLGALVNSVFLIALCFSILVEALKRFVEVEQIQNPKLMLIVGALGLGVNLIGLALFHNHGHSHGGGGGHGHSHGGGSKHKHEGNDDHTAHKHGSKESESLVNPSDTNGTTTVSVAESVSEHDETVIEFDSERASSAQLNMRAVFLHVLGDALGSVIVIISALLVWFVKTDWVMYIDPALSVMLVIIILFTTIPLLKEASMILLQTVPTHIGIKEMKDRLEEIDGISAVHELHIWQLTGNKVIASLHIRCKNSQDYAQLASKVTDIFHNEGVHSTTIQPEFIDEVDGYNSKDCMIGCGPDKNCYQDTCCAPPKKSSPNKTETTPKSAPKSPRPNSGSQNTASPPAVV